MSRPPIRARLVETRSAAVRLSAPVGDFLKTETGGAFFLLLAAGLALLWANSPWRDSYESLWTTHATLRIGSWEIERDLRHLVTEGLMTFFFLVVSLEIKREVVAGELNDFRKAALPVIAAVGGMVVPALIYVGLNLEGPGSRGWGIPMATDIAFAIGALALIGSRVPASLKIFLLSVAVADDVGAILVIAIFYAETISSVALAAAAAIVAALVLLRSMRVLSEWIYIVLGIALWGALLQSGVHATMAGVILGLLSPVSRLHGGDDWAPHRPPGEPGPASFQAAREQAQGAAGASRTEDEVHPFSSLVVVPLFALASAGVSLAASDVSFSTISAGIILGLVVGKPLGISLFALLAVKTRIAALPEGTTWPHIFGVGALGGIGFTVSLFVAHLGLPESELHEAKIGILVASALAGIAGLLVLRLTLPEGPADEEAAEG